MTYNLDERIDDLTQLGFVYYPKFEDFTHNTIAAYVNIIDIKTKTEEEWADMIQKIEKAIQYQSFKDCLKTHISAKDLPAYEQQISELIDGGYCLDNYSEDGDKMESLIFQHHVDQNIEATAHLYDNVDGMKDLLQLMENHNIEFITC